MEQRHEANYRNSDRFIELTEIPYSGYFDFGGFFIDRFQIERRLKMSDSIIDSEQSEFIQAFVEEGREMLDEVEPLLIELEQESDPSSGVDPEILNTIFRLFHSLKGAAGFLELETVSSVTHEAETILDIIRKGEASLKSEHVDLFNRAADFIRVLLESISQNYNDKGFEDQADKIIRELKDTIDDLRELSTDSGSEGEKGSHNKGLDTSEKQNNKGTLRIWYDEEISEQQIPAVESKNDVIDTDQLQFTVSEETIKTFISEAEELIEKAEESLLSLEKKPGDQELVSRAFRALHSIKGNAGFLGYGDIEEISHRSETLLDSLKECGGKGRSGIFSLILNALDFIRTAITDLSEGREPIISCKAGVIALLEEAIDKIVEGGEEENETPETPQQQAEVPAIYGAGDGENLSGETDKKPIQTPEYTGPDRRSGTDRRADVDGRIGGRRAADKTSTARQTIRVDIVKLDVMMDLVGELVISEAMVGQNPDLNGLNVSLDRFERSVLQLNKITRDLQDVATSMRMIQLSGTFRKMIRLVRDLSQKVDKKVELEIIGEETEVDKTVIEQINDPLVHIIRNSIDHGFESIEERRESGKPETGKIILEAKYVGGEVWIIIKDDGRGLDRSKIVARAVERGLLEGDGSDLKNDDIWQLIFQPGFSTAEKITDVSGRGVGMDVVRKNIEKIRGKVDVKSEPGSGTSVILRIPLTLAIIDGMIVRVGKTRYTIPIVSIKESLKPEKGMVSKLMDGQEVVNIRNQLLPVIRLHEFFNIASDTEELSEGILVIVENEGQSVCIFLDEVIGQQQVVIKGLSKYVGDVHSASGCTILGDGTISLILDIKAMIDKAEGGVIDKNRKLRMVSKNNQNESADVDNDGIEEIIST